MELTLKIYNSTVQLPDSWDNLAVNNIFLTTNYLKVLETSAPKNMDCRFIGFFENQKLVGIAVSQFLNLNQLESFGERDKCIKTAIRNFIFKKFSSHVLFIGNNMLTGQNCYAFETKIDTKSIPNLLKKAVILLKEIYKSKGTKIHLTSYKDFSEIDANCFKSNGFENYYQFSTQPNMVFIVRENWNNQQNYIDDLSKKYRDQYKRSHKKAEGIVKQKMSLNDILKHEKTINDLYFHVAKNAPFNTFFLAENHFSTFKESLKDNFLFYGYFMDNQLIGFNTLIKNGNILDTYFLGYDDSIQREKMLYLNMLYDMIGYAINKQFKEIIFARTALEIKSAVGANPEKVYGFIEHSNRFLNKYMHKIFPYLEPEMVWQKRNPFK
jgi:hypothetical protein